MQSKQAKILDLLEATNLNNAEIADAVGCVPAYVRTVQQRLLNGGITKADARWRKNNPNKVGEYRHRHKIKRRLAQLGAE